MKWFSHDVGARHDPKLLKFRKEYGNEGYAFFFMVIEIMAEELKPVDIDLVLARELWTDEEHVKEMASIACELGLFDQEFYNLTGQLWAPKLEHRADNWTKRQKRENKEEIDSNIRSISTKVSEHWNKTTLPRIDKWSTGRLRKLSSRWTSEHFREKWKESVDKLAASSFCKGNGNRGWKANIDWFVDSDTNYIKALEGKYDDRAKDRFSKY